MALLPEIRNYLVKRALEYDWFESVDDESVQFRVSSSDHNTATDQVTVSLSDAATLIPRIAPHAAVVLEGPPGSGKSEVIQQIAANSGLPCVVVHGAQLLPEDLTGPAMIRDGCASFTRNEDILGPVGQPIALFLDELAASSPDVQKAMYSLLLDRRIGRHSLAPGSWVIAAGNCEADRSFRQEMSAALINRVFIIHLRVDVGEWLAWAESNGIRPEIRRFIARFPEALSRPAPAENAPFSSPRAWTHLSRAWDCLDTAQQLTPRLRRCLAFGRVSAIDAEILCAGEESRPAESARSCVFHPDRLPTDAVRRWAVIDKIRAAVRDGSLAGTPPRRVQAFLRALSSEELALVLIENVETWGSLGADEVIVAVHRRLTHLGGPWLRAVAAK